MSLLRRTLRQIWFFLNRSRLERELEIEMASHRSEMRDGRAFGDITRVRERNADALGWTRVDDLWRDVVYAARSFRRNRVFTVVAMATLALGIGANTAIFSVVNGVLIRPLAYEAADRQVRLQVLVESRTGTPEQRSLELTAAETRDIAREFAGLEYVGNVGMSFTNWRGYEPRWSGAAVTASVFQMLGVRPVIGRLLEPADEQETAPDVIVIGHRTWLRHFGADPNVLGRTITLEPALTGGRPATQTPFTIVGVAPAGFEYLPGSAAQYWVPLRQSRRGAVVARLAGGVSADSAIAALEPRLRTLQTRTTDQRPLAYEFVGLQQELVAPVKRALLLLMGAVAFVLLIACVNVANLLMVRSVARQREMAIRVAIGAGQGRIVRLMMVESMMLTGAGAIAGTVLATGGLRVLRWLATTADRLDLGQRGGRMIPSLDAVTLDPVVLAFTMGVTCAIALTFGLIPSLHARRFAPAGALRSASAQGHDRPSGATTVRSTLIVAEVALSIVLLIGGGLLIASFVRLMRVDFGYQADGVLTFQVSVPSERYPLTRQRAFAEEFVAQLQLQPGVTAAAYAKQLPLVQLRDTLVVGRTFDADRRLATHGADVRVVSQQYLTSMRIPVIAGRGFDGRDGAGRSRALVINETLARREFGTVAAAPGQHAYVSGDPDPWTVIGVVADVRQMQISAAAAPQIFVDARQWGEGLSPLFPLSPYYVLRTDLDDSAAISGVRAALAKLEPEGVLFNVSPMADILSVQLARPRMYAVVVGVFAVIGISMALVGIYGVVSYTVSQRTRELGIRMALGAPRTSVLGLVVRQTLLLTCAGVAIGLLAAAALTRTLETMLFELTPLDPATFASAAILFVLCATFAAIVPGHRATRVDPLVALKSE